MTTSPRTAGFLVLGLGNPGPRYEGTRHNLGARVVDAFARAERVAVSPGPGPYRMGEAEVGGRRGLVALPSTFMNRSGAAVRDLLERFPDLPLERMLVAFDDLDLPLGRVRFRRGGSDGGHNGVRSVIDAAGSREFARLRLGIGRPGDVVTGVIDHVLEPFLPEERDVVEEMVVRGVEGIHVFLADGVETAMNRFNAVSGGE
jgi:PTH1 family peptidyl-tRNA hydrolase